MHLPKIEISFGQGLKIGFATVLLLLSTLMAVSLYSVHQIDKHLDLIVEQSLVKSKQASDMQTALRERAISMHLIASMDDPFAREAEFLHFNALGAQFLRARQLLESLTLTQEEKTYWITYVKKW